MERSFNQSLRLQQDEAYMLSLLADQEKERLRCQEIQRLEGEEQMKRELQQIELERKEVSQTCVVTKLLMFELK